MVFIGNFKDEYYFSIDGITPILMIIVALIGFIKNKANIDSAFRLAH
jgi:F0F1-type ATP synthase assembly protein I